MVKISVDTDVDMYRITVAKGQTVDIDIDTPFNGPGGLGSYLRLFNSSGQQLASNNDGAAPGETRVGFDSFLRYRFTNAGTYFVAYPTGSIRITTRCRAGTIVLVVYMRLARTR